MAFSDPLSLTISGTAYSLPKTFTQGSKGVYTSADGLVSVTADHTSGQRVRHVLRVDHAKVTPDPFIPANNSKVGMKNYLVFDMPQAGYTATEALNIYQGFKAMFSASTDALIVKLLGFES